MWTRQGLLSNGVGKTCSVNILKGPHALPISRRSEPRYVNALENAGLLHKTTGP